MLRAPFKAHLSNVAPLAAASAHKAQVLSSNQLHSLKNSSALSSVWIARQSITWSPSRTSSVRIEWNVTSCVPRSGGSWMLRSGTWSVKVWIKKRE